MELTDKAKTTTTPLKVKSTYNELVAASLKKLQELLDNDDCTAGDIAAICHDIVIFSDKHGPMGNRKDGNDRVEEVDSNQLKESCRSMQKCLLNISFNLNRIASQSCPSQFTSKLDYVRYSLSQLALWADEVIKSSMDLDQAPSLSETLNTAMASSIATLTSSVIAWLVLLVDDNEDRGENEQVRHDQVNTRKESLRSFQTTKVVDNHYGKEKGEEDKENNDHPANGPDRRDKELRNNDGNVSKMYDRSSTTTTALNNCLPRTLVDPSSIYPYSTANRRNPITATIMDPYQHVQCLAQYPMAAGKYVIDGSYAIANANNLNYIADLQQQQQQQQQHHQQQNNSTIQQRLSPVKFTNNERQELSPSTLKRSPICKYCGKSFSSNSYLKAHIRVHEIPDSFRCPECNKLFSCTSSLNKHIKDYHNGVILPDEEQVDGDVADDEKSNNSDVVVDPSRHITASTHPIIHRSDDMINQYHHRSDSSAIANEENGQHHQFRYHPSYYHQQPVNCSRPGDDELSTPQAINDNRSSLYHQNNHTKLTTSTPSQDNDIATYRSVSVSNNGSANNDINATSNTTTALNHSDNQNSPDDSKRSSFISKVGEDDNGKNYYECEICNKQFTSLTYMKAHVKMHNQPSSCVCKFCNKPFSCISAVNKHMKKYHEKEYYSQQKAIKQSQQHQLNQHDIASNANNKDDSMTNNNPTNQRRHSTEDHTTHGSNNTNSSLHLPRQSNHYDDNNNNNIPLFANQNTNHDRVQTRHDYQDNTNFNQANGHDSAFDVEVYKAARTEGHHKANHVSYRNDNDDDDGMDSTSEHDTGVVTRRMVTRQSKELIHDGNQNEQDHQHESDMAKSDDNDGSNATVTDRSGRLRYACDFCSKSFTSVYYLREHVKKHSGAYQCNYCQKFFSNNLSLKRHVSIQHVDVNPDKIDQINTNTSNDVKPSESRIYPCSTCSEKFNTISDLEEHNRQHGLVPCSLCTMTFSSYISLKKHLSTYHAKGNNSRSSSNGHTENGGTNRISVTTSSANTTTNGHRDHVSGSPRSHYQSPRKDINNEASDDGSHSVKTSVRPMVNPPASSLVHSATKLKNQSPNNNGHSKYTSDVRSDNSNSRQNGHHRNNDNHSRHHHHHSITRNGYYERSDNDNYRYEKRPASNGHHYQSSRRKRSRTFTGGYY